MIKVRVNGRECEFDADMSVEEFLHSQGYELKFIAVEADGEILSKTLWETTQISNFKVYEIVEFVGGG
ncbi:MULTISPECIES: sulfur carrier protein ThiS [unclassified Campylobacter]|uniref:sulfur carrier protein ThiS n=1 Tax=unclassified Campylobacter TaxID=2593542 RepID=UPI0022E9B596|nr:MULTISPECIES: sulfur carrier protein ThiS [unclassified Campylobacter]MDA3055635.1 sulfur carrier protein ThiS [Campylobacter sp. CN_NA1]MDA3064675.1 sulfur carrier protein ThiS [Campylobacter sp. CN_NE4]MDA3068501.1 sulfur carrier protein ThiS [Campylobacter sp. CN_NE3]MDA3082186.1 sulfur carrier protein ThiS [Campylobacter sp. CN_EL2]MDA3083821.1 sulfur carrier protein ThiS [Campylobacter sp. CN_NE1]